MLDITAAYSSCHVCNAEYRDGSSVFRDKIRSLEQQYMSIRRTRGDGNCAFRAFIFGYMEQLVNTNDLQERNRSAAYLLSEQVPCHRNTANHHLVYQTVYGPRRMA